MAARPGEREAFESFAASEGIRLRRALVARYGVDIGTEVCADALAVAWQRWAEVQAMVNPVGYLYRVGQSAARRYIRWARRPSFPPERVGDGGGSEHDLGAALARLPEQQRSIVLLVHAHGMSYAEVAETLGISAGAVRNQLHRGLGRLRRQLEVGNDG